MVIVLECGSGNELAMPPLPLGGLSGDCSTPLVVRTECAAGVAAPALGLVLKKRNGLSNRSLLTDNWSLLGRGDGGAGAGSLYGAPVTACASKC